MAHLSPLQADRALGCFIGLAVGDALGAPVEFKARGTFPFVTGYQAGGTHNLLPGQWTDDTAMALALADSLVTHKSSSGVPELAGVVDRWLSWWHGGTYSCTGNCFDIGNQTRSALLRWETKGKPPQPTDACGNGALMRLAPVVLATARYPSPFHAKRLAGKQTKLTHNNLECIQLSRSLARWLHGLIRGDVTFIWLDLTMSNEQLISDGHARHTLEAALACVAGASSFEEAVLRAVNLGHDTDTVGAVTGQLAGARWGLAGIPPAWVEQLAWRKHLLTIGGALLQF